MGLIETIPDETINPDNPLDINLNNFNITIPSVEQPLVTEGLNEQPSTGEVALDGTNINNVNLATITDTTNPHLVSDETLTKINLDRDFLEALPRKLIIETIVNQLSM